NQAVATVSSDGTVTCRSVGGAVITATADGKTGTCYVTYEKVPVTNVKITKGGLFFNSIGQTYKLKAEVEPSNATYKDVTWYSTNTSVATVDNNGLVTCKGFGTATITATADGHGHGCIVMSNQSYLVDPCRNMYLYKQIGNQVWMTQNMRCNIYDTQSERPNATIETYSYKNSHSATYVPYCVDASIRDNWKSSACADELSDLQVNSLGYLYNWEAAVGTLDYTSSFSSRRQGICPNGWHVPTDEEYSTLFNYVGKTQAGKKLRTTSGWCNGINGTDDYAFSVLPAGYANGNEVVYVGRESYLTTATTASQSYAWTINFSRNSDNECAYFIESTPKNNAYGVRCVKN
ncbi:MAG: Ig-like domain-containing protein, partial [Paludibacteraceae bacterium]|nr:Ig-like domain-containing protein [Paludibacteraceae bacterium]